MLFYPKGALYGRSNTCTDTYLYVFYILLSFSSSSTFTSLFIFFNFIFFVFFLRLGATSLHGKEKKIFEAKQLAELGVHLEHKIKMPYKMYKGVMKARQHREAKQQEYARLSGLVVPKVINNKDNKDDERKKRYEDNDADDDPTPRNIRGPVMYLTGNNNNKSHHKKNHNHHRTMNKFGKNK